MAAAMVGPEYARYMARYNAWQNQWMYQAADALTEAERELDRGAFFGGIRSTLSHLMWGDTIWIARFDGEPGIETLLGVSHTAFDWPTLMAKRPQLDARFAAWAWMTDDSDFEGEIRWTSSSTGRAFSLSRAACVMQMFNHQTHHRGQVHAMLTACGVETVDTDLPYMPDEVPEWR
jgi:uncharacterized damage-inducible protein DinB